MGTFKTEVPDGNQQNCCQVDRLIGRQDQILHIRDRARAVIVFDANGRMGKDNILVLRHATVPCPAGGYANTSALCLDVACSL